jgi:hypothetical protein
MSAEAQDRLRGQQAQLVAALMQHHPAPGGFDEASLQVAAESLARKRLRSVRRAWPVLVEVLGDRFEERFSAYGQQTNLPAHGGPLADARAFVRWLAKHEEIPPTLEREATALDLRYKTVAGGLVPRRGPGLLLRWLRSSGSLVIGVKLPGVRVLGMWTIPLRVVRRAVRASGTTEPDSVPDRHPGRS